MAFVQSPSTPQLPLPDPGSVSLPRPAWLPTHPGPELSPGGGRGGGLRAPLLWSSGSCTLPSRALKPLLRALLLSVCDSKRSGASCLRPGAGGSVQVHLQTCTHSALTFLSRLHCCAFLSGGGLAAYFYSSVQNTNSHTCASQISLYFLLKTF